MPPQAQGRRQRQAQGGGYGGDYQRRRPAGGGFAGTGFARDGFAGRRRGAQSRQGGQPPVAGAGIHRQPLKGQRLRFRQQVNGRVVAQVSQQLVVTMARILQPGRHHQHRPLPELPQSAEVQRLALGINGKRRPGPGAGEVAEMTLHPGLGANQGKQSGKSHSPP